LKQSNITAYYPITSFFTLVWRIVVGISLIPAFGTLYQRVTLPESKRFIFSQKLKLTGQHTEAQPGDIAELEKEKATGERSTDADEKPSKNGSAEIVEERNELSEDNDLPLEVLIKKKAHFKGMISLPCLAQSS
jgi:PHS family inorganic phosphate transporter-like MFS transporter